MYCTVKKLYHKTFTFLDKDSYVVQYKSIVWFHLEYANRIESPHTVQDKKIWK